MEPNRDHLFKLEGFGLLPCMKGTDVRYCHSRYAYARNGRPDSFAGNPPHFGCKIHAHHHAHLSGVARWTHPSLQHYLTKPVKQSSLYNAVVGALTGADGKSLCLTAEDNAANQKLALKILSRMGYLADVAGNGPEVLQAIERQTYDLVFMDVHMPEMDGLETTRNIRSKFPAARQPYIIAMTANAMQGDREMCLAVGMNDYISKPIQIRELVSALERCDLNRQS